MAGFVNGIDPVVNGVGLLQNPTLPLTSFRFIGKGSGSQEQVPLIFQQMGVENPERDIQITAENFDSVFSSLSSEVFASKPKRRLAAVDIVLSVPRASLVGQVEIVDATGASGSIAQYRIGLETGHIETGGTRGTLRAVSKYEPPRQPTLAERIMGLYTDPKEDTLLLSTCYFLSPTDERVSSFPDSHWLPFVAHQVFWNLCHAPRNLVPRQPPPPITLFTGLAAGIGDVIGNQILSQINEFSDRVFNAINNTTNEGRFWSV